MIKLWFSEKYRNFRVWFKSLWSEIMLIPIKGVQIVNSILAGMNVQLSTTRGVTIFSIVSVVLYDIWHKGSAGIIQFSINVFVKLLEDIFKIVQSVAVIPLIICAILIVAFIEYKKMKK